MSVSDSSSKGREGGGRGEGARAGSGVARHKATGEGQGTVMWTGLSTHPTLTRTLYPPATTSVTLVLDFQMCTIVSFGKESLKCCRSKTVPSGSNTRDE